MRHTTRRSPLTTGGTLLAALLAFTASTAAQKPPALRTLYSFTGGADGLSARADVVNGKGGVLYGTAYQGGTGACPSGCGTVFSLTPPASPGGVWTETTLYSFTGHSDGVYPSSVVIGSGGVLHGTAHGGSGFGTVFSLAPPAGGPSGPGGAWTETTLYSFTGGSGGGDPAGVVTGKDGALYGATWFGGTANHGTVFQLTPPASPGGAWTETTLHSFTGAIFANGVVIGCGPSGHPVLYGTTHYGGTGPCTLAYPGCGTGVLANSAGVSRRFLD